MFASTNNINFESQNLGSLYHEACYSTRGTKTTTRNGALHMTVQGRPSKKSSQNYVVCDGSFQGFTWQLTYVSVRHTKREKLWIWMEQTNICIDKFITSRQRLQSIYIYAYCVKMNMVTCTQHLCYDKLAQVKIFHCTNLVDEKDLHSFKFFLLVRAVFPRPRGIHIYDSIYEGLIQCSA